MSDKQLLPESPFDSQEFVDAFGIKWVYESIKQTWTKVGVVADVPVARPEGHEDGPTNGLMSARDKELLDRLGEKAGGFGIILRPGRYLSDENAADNILTGDVEIVSNTLDFECTTEDGGDGCGLPTVRFGLGRDFLESYILELRGPRGPKGDKGDKGRDGRPGTGDGPRGEPGEDGKDATEAHEFSGIKIEELDEVYDTAVVNLRLDAPSGVLEVTKAKLDTPDNDKPATRVAATPILRSVEFDGDTLDGWQLVAPTDDPSPTTDVNLVKLPKGWAGSDSPVPVVPVRLTNLVQSIIDFYKDEAGKVLDEWETQLREWAVATDKSARDALHDLAKQVAECEFDKPLEFCLGIEPFDCSSANLGNTAVIFFIDEAEPVYFPAGQSNWAQDVSALNTLISQNEASFDGLTIEAWIPGGRGVWNSDVVPPGVDYSQFTLRDIPRTPTSSDLVSAYIDMRGRREDFDTIILIVDNSGSMTLNTIQPGYGQFVSWLSSATSANINESSTQSERWVGVTANVLQQLLQPNGNSK